MGVGCWSFYKDGVMANDPPKNIAHYQVIRQLGKRGGFGTVYLARDNKLKRDVAIKVIHPHLAVDSGMVKRFIREAQSMAKLNHPNIVIVHAVEDDPRKPYIVMEYVKGKTLKDLLQYGALPIKKALPILIQMAEALDAAHEQGMVHRDVKPANVLLRDDGRVKLTDFGIVKILQSQDIALTPAMATVGTSRYMSPEQADFRRQGEIGFASDIYALGVVAYQMLAGQVPFSGTSNALIQEAHRSEPPPDPRSFNSQMLEPIAMVLMKVLAKDPQNRYPTASAFVMALSQAAKIEGMIISTGRLPRYDTFSEDQTALSTQDKQYHMANPASLSGRLPAVPEPVKPPAQYLRHFLVISVLVLAAIIVGGIMNNLFTQLPTPDPIFVEVMITGTPEPTEQPSPTATEVPPTIPPSETPLPSATLVPSALPTDTPAAATGLGDVPTELSEIDEMRLLYVAEGSFEMGSPRDIGQLDEGPIHTVFLDAFWIDQTEVTNEMYVAFLNAQGNQQEGGVAWLELDDEDAYIEFEDGVFKPKEGAEQQPVSEVTWFGANAYCKWAGRRLPTEAEWEKAARGNQRGQYPWGEEQPLSFRLNFDQQVSNRIPVGSYPQGASPYGALDMAGNVEEWVNDWFDPAYYRNSPPRNPLGPRQPRRDRILRGGSWYDTAYEVRSTYRNKDLPTESVDDRGFRCAISASDRN